MKIYLLLLALITFGSCKKIKNITTNQQEQIHLVDSSLVAKYSASITASSLKENLYLFASPAFAGRATGEEGQKKAVRFLANFYKSQGIASPIADTSYFQHIPKTFLPENIQASENVLAYIKGSEKPEEVLIISGHLDHLGLNEKDIFFGADDNGSGTVAILEIAKAFKAAQDQGISPKRSILFLHLTAEEIGLQGSLYYTKNPIFKLENTIANLNIDMIGRVDPLHKENPNYIYIIGADRLSKELHYINEKVNKNSTNLLLEYKYNEKEDSNRYYYRSDHYNFAKQNIPVIFYFNGEHEDYHKPTDTPDKINYTLLKKRTQLIFGTAWQLANQENRLILNKDN
ncbi:M28 family peptidase [Lacinutrix sp. C3R15]|uniref:M28 family metallopeptidase n=1 Tax=Flavobacteriaceae TaxID=49546 RepID=UPI001C08031F|nr:MULTISPECIES: M28 family metallopeptidase [Flavobacteriaceae]MBU2940566.1 M28 family peptidase [Lacinutrix sp. C3R15]MDO6623885.1 M28 family metallopeptidase [Oceanihabitans sp. 1_MG-2023]